MPQTAVEKYVKGFADWTVTETDVHGQVHTRADLWMRKLRGANNATIAGVTEAVLAGSLTAGSVLRDLALFRKSYEVLLRQTRDPHADIADPAISFNRLVMTSLIFNRYLRRINPMYEPFKKNVLARLKSGTVPAADSLRFMVHESTSVHESDPKFAVTILANSTYVLPEASRAAVNLGLAIYINDNARFAENNWPEILREREHLFATRWLAAQVSKAEYRATRGVTVDLLKGLYPQVWADGYDGYARAVAAKAAAHG